MTTIDVEVLGRFYKIECDENAKTDLLNTARRLDQQMKETQRDMGRVGQDRDRVVIMTAINLCHEASLGSGELAKQNILLQEKVDELTSNIATTIKRIS